MSNFGAGFKKARESAGLSLETIAAETRISTRFLQAIENEEFATLPGGVFNRGFIRTYAQRVGIDPDQAVTDYERLAAATEEPLETQGETGGSLGRNLQNALYPLAALILLVAIVGYYALRRDTAPVPDKPPAAAAPTESQVDPPVPPEAATTNAQAPPPTAAAPAPVPAAAPAVRPAPVPVPQTTPAASALVLDLDVKGETWIEILADGQRVLSEILQPGSTRRFSAQASLDIAIGNAGGASIRVNGRDIGTLGQNGQVREIKITPENAATIRG